MSRRWRTVLALSALALAVGALGIGGWTLARRASDFRRRADALEVLERRDHARARAYLQAADHARARQSAYRHGIEGVGASRRLRLHAIRAKAGADSPFGQAADDGLRRASDLDPAWVAEIERQAAETDRVVGHFRELARLQEEAAESHALQKRAYRRAAGRPWAALTPEPAAPDRRASDPAVPDPLRVRTRGPSS